LKLSNQPAHRLPGHSVDEPNDPPPPTKPPSKIAEANALGLYSSLGRYVDWHIVNGNVSGFPQFCRRMSR
jgi:hypothetical protein